MDAPKDPRQSDKKRKSLNKEAYYCEPLGLGTVLAKEVRRNVEERKPAINRTP